MATIKQTVFKWILDLAWRLKMSPDPYGAPRAKELIMWYIFGNGKPFIRRSGVWSQYMRTRPAIQEAMEDFALEFAQEVCDNKQNSGTFEKNIGYVQLDSEAMEFTLNTGTVGVQGSYQVKRGIGYCNVFFDSKWTWYDRGDLHDQKVTILDSGEAIKDQTLREIGELLGGTDYDIELSWIRDLSVHLEVPVKQVLDTKTDSSGAIVEYEVEGLGWISKSEAIELAKSFEIDAVVVKGANGTYLRSRPDSSSYNNFSEMAKD